MRTAWGEGNFAYAETMGTAFPSIPFKGIVHSVFPHALNFQDVADNTLYSLLTDRDSLYPRGIVVHPENHNPLDFISLGFQAGQTATTNQMGITFDCGRWVSFLGANRTDSRDENPPQSMTMDISLVNIGCTYLLTLQESAHAKIRLTHLTSSDRANSLFSQRFSKFAQKLKYSFSANHLETAVISGKALIGFGPGLTPTGDDFLCGFALAVFLRSKLQPGAPGYIEEKFVLDWLASMLEKAGSPTPLTNLISMNFLSLAALGKFSYRLVQLASAFETQNENRLTSLIEALDSLHHHGHSSGLDAATGFLFGLTEGDPNLD